MTNSYAALLGRLASTSPEARRAILARRETLEWNWRTWARPEQLEPEGEYSVWLVLAGRGWGKTRTGAEWVRRRVESGARWVALVAPTAADAREVMIEGESGILRCSPPWDRPSYEPSKRRLTWQSGAIATAYSADEPERLRGPQHDSAWCDELCSWRYLEDAWTQLQFGLRLGPRPRTCVTTTPKPIPMLRELMGRADRDRADVRLTRGATWDNAVWLAPSFLEAIRARYEGTRIGRQEIYAEVLADVEGALWNWSELEACRVASAPELTRVVVAVDPAVTNTQESCETGIVVAGRGKDGKVYVLADYSGRYHPATWAKKAVEAYESHRADRVVGEANNGGDLVEAVLRQVDPRVSYRKVIASRGKQTRAEPVAALYEKGGVRHLGGLGTLEQQMATWSPGSGSASPDRIDALVWAITELGLDGGGIATGRIKLWN